MGEKGGGMDRWGVERKGKREEGGREGGRTLLGLEMPLFGGGGGLVFGYVLMGWVESTFARSALGGGVSDLGGEGGMGVGVGSWRLLGWMRM